MQELRDTAGPRTVAVVGAGPSGLAAARELERAGHRVTVLEEQTTVAGKCQSVHVNGRAYDLGGHICTNRYERVAELLTELDVQTERTSRYRVLDAGGRAVRQSMAFLRDGAVGRYRALRAREFPASPNPGSPIRRGRWRLPSPDGSPSTGSGRWPTPSAPGTRRPGTAVSTTTCPRCTS